MGVDLTTQNGTQMSASEPSALIQLAIERKVDVDILERLVALQERVTERNARAAFFEALSRFQDQCPEIRKSKTANIETRNGGSYQYKYAPLEEISRTVREPLRNNGLSYSWDVEQADAVLLIICVLRHIDGHHERSTFPVPIESGARMSGAQKNGAALTYGKRQSLVAVLGLTTADDDVDGVGGKESGTITDQQAADLDALLEETKSNKTKFLQLMGVERLADLSASEYERAVRVVQQKRRA